MSAFKDYWTRLGLPARAVLVGGSLLIAVALATAAYWLSRTDYEVLFSDLSTRDAATMVAELEKEKVPYRLDRNGTAILVPADIVPSTRIKLVNKDLPLQGGVGFELFNNSDVGITDFAQKVNYLRALQGELTRTIMSIDGVQTARVHLVLPEQGLFRKAGAQAKASVTLTLKNGGQLTREQIKGVQRLVAAAVAEVKADDVTVLDQRGIALSRPGPDGDGDAAAEWLADGKRQLEDYLARKVAEVLDSVFGAHQSIVRVDAVLNPDHMKVTTENVLPANAADGRPAGVIVREHDAGAAAGTASATESAAPGAARNRDVQYQVGRRVEQIVTRAGAVSRLHVAVIIRSPLDGPQLERVKDLVSAAVGLNKLRGDAIAIYAADQLTGPAPGASAPAALTQDAPADETPMVRAAVPRSRVGWSQSLSLVLGAVVLLILAVSHWTVRRAKRVSVPPAALSDAERQALLTQVRGWLEPAKGGQAGEPVR